jgi:predicted Zn finger-like uncharacterized protein
MFTDCPSCSRQFRIHAEQISAANGLVRCGYCGEQFNTLERLHDKPLPESELAAPPPNTDVTVDAEPEPEPQFDISIAENELSINRPDVKDNVSDKNSDDPDILFNDLKEISAEGDANLHDMDSGDQDDNEADSQAKLAIDYPEELEEFLVEKKARQNPAGRLLWGLAALLVAVLIVAQVAWFNRDERLFMYPELVPRMKQLCEKLDCELIHRRDVAAIKLLNRDVRSHPRFVNTLLVNATMTNLSQGVQLFPRVQLTLFDTSGNIVAFREFKPAEYLDNSIGIDEGMPPNYPVHFVLEVTGPTEGAVSFEFRFL